MDNKLLLAKCINLLYKESLLKEPENSSRALVDEAIKRIQPREVGLSLGTDKDAVTALKETVQDLLSTPNDQQVDKLGLLQRIRIDAGDNDKLYQALEKGLQEDVDVADIRKSIASSRRSIEKHCREQQVSDILTRASASWNFNREKIQDTGEFLRTMWGQLEPLTSLKTKEDPAILDEIRVGDKAAMKKVISNIHVSAVENRVYKTGWQGLNRMLQGGIRPGEFWVQAGLQHKYKTGLSQSIFNQVALYNRPMTNIPGKKPALIHYAFEDTTEQRLKFIVEQLYYSEHRQEIDIRHYTEEQLQDIIHDKLSINGFEVFFVRVNPSYWTYQDLFQHVLKIEAQGHSIEFVMIDYLEKLPTTGCVQSGPVGNDVLDLFSRTRMFFNSKGIACWTPHQLSADSKMLIRGTVTEDKFLQTIVGRGYYKGTKQLDQIPDGIILNHIFERGGETFLSIQRDRHRISSIVDEKYKHMYLRFPSKMPMPDDLNDEDSTIYKLPPYRGNVDSSLFSFDA